MNLRPLQQLVFVDSRLEDFIQGMSDVHEPLA